MPYRFSLSRCLAFWRELFRHTRFAEPSVPAPIPAPPAAPSEGPAMPSLAGLPLPGTDLANGVPATADTPGQPPGVVPGEAPSPWESYLLARGNPLQDIRRIPGILAKGEVILEIGCGDGEVAWRIAARNPGMGVIATDCYDCGARPDTGSLYGKVARLWQDRRLPAQEMPLENLVVLRAELDFLDCLPPRSLDSLLLINAEPSVGRKVVDFLSAPGLHSAVKPGERQGGILPHSREMGVCTSGGYEFDHGEDWSCGLGYLMASPLGFRKGSRLQWGIDLCRGSAYSCNSTQQDVYICGLAPNSLVDPALIPRRPRPRM